MGRSAGIQTRFCTSQRRPPPLLPQPGGRAPRSGEAWITAGSQAPSQDQGGGAEGVLLLQTLSGLSEAINSPGLSPRALANPLGRWETTRAARTPISLLWLKHCSSSFAIAHITRSLFYKCRGPRVEQYYLPWRAGPGSRASSRTSSLDPSHSSGAPAATYPHLGISRKNNFCSQAH